MLALTPEPTASWSTSLAYPSRTKAYAAFFVAHRK
jgi:hypothetical protein